MAFATLPDLETYAGQTYTDDQAFRAEQALEHASALIQSVTRQTLYAVTGDVVVLTPNIRGVVVLPQLPVTSVTSVVDEDLTALTFTVGSAGLLRLTSSWVGPVTVTYSHGYAEIPVDLQIVCLSLASSALDSAATGVQSERIGSYAVTYATGNESGALSSLERSVLDRYTMRSLA